MLRGVVCADTVGDGVFEIARRGAGVEVALQMACRGAGVEVAPQIARRLLRAEVFARFVRTWPKVPARSGTPQMPWLFGFDSSPK